MDAEVAKHLSETYGDRAGDVAKMASVTGRRHPIVGKRLAEDFPYIEAEVGFCVDWLGFLFVLESSFKTFGKVR